MQPVIYDECTDPEIQLEALAFQIFEKILLRHRVPLWDALLILEHNIIREGLKHTRKKVHVADTLGISPQTLQNKIKRLSIKI